MQGGTLTPVPSPKGEGSKAKTEEKIGRWAFHPSPLGEGPGVRVFGREGAPSPATRGRDGVGAPYSPTQLQARLLNTYYTARMFLEEQGGSA